MNKTLMIAGLILVMNAAGLAQAFEKLCPTITESHCVQARKMIESAWVINVGQEIGKDEWAGAAGTMLKYGTVSESQFSAGIKLSDASKFVRMYISKLSPGDGQRAVANAFLEVYGTAPTEAENGFWLAQVKMEKAWYSTIVIAEAKKLNSDKTVRSKTIGRAFSQVLGRSAKPEELTKWLGRTEHFRLMYNLLRNELYSPPGVTDLRDTVRRALSAANYKKGNKNYSAPDAEIDKYVALFTPKKLTHPEMLAYLFANY